MIKKKKGIGDILSFVKKRTGSAPSCSVVIAAAGASVRMAGEDKLFIDICGKPVLAHTLSAFQNCSLVTEIVVVAQESKIAPIGELCNKYGIDKATMLMIGGATRLESVLNGVLAASPTSGLIAIHDGARPCVELSTIESTVISASKHYAAAPGVKISSTIKRVVNGVIHETVNRDSLYEIQTPQVFDADLIKAALTNAMQKSLNVTDDCMAVELIGAKVHITEGSSTNIKITTFEDVSVAEAILGKGAL